MSEGARRHSTGFESVAQRMREVGQNGNARKAVIARLFVDAHLRAPQARGIISNSRTALDLFIPLTRYGSIEPAHADAALRHA